MNDKVVEIGDYAFKGCTALESIKLNEGIIRIRSGAFNGCTNLKTISFPESLQKIYDYAFQGCTVLEDIYYSGTNRGNIDTGWGSNSELFSAWWHYTKKPSIVQDGLTYDENIDGTGCTLVKCNKNISGNIQIPEKVNGLVVKETSVFSTVSSTSFV